MASKRLKNLIIKLHIKAGAASPTPPVGPLLGQHGVNISKFCADFNAATAAHSAKGYFIPTTISVLKNKSFTFVLKAPLTRQLIFEALNCTCGSSTPSHESIGYLSTEKMERVAELKGSSLNAKKLRSRVLSISGTAKSMGVDV